MLHVCLVPWKQWDWSNDSDGESQYESVPWYPFFCKPDFMYERSPSQVLKMFTVA